MNLPEDQVKELEEIYPDVKQAMEAGVVYFLLPQLALPTGCTPEYVDVLLCPWRICVNYRKKICTVHEYQCARDQLISFRHSHVTFRC